MMASRNPDAADRPSAWPGLATVASRDDRSGRILRALCICVSVCAILGSALVTEDFLARHLSPDGNFAEPQYVTALRFVGIAVGVVGLFISLRARRETLQGCAVGLFALIIAVLALEGALRLLERVSSTNAPTSPSGLRATAYPGLFYENTPGFTEDGEQKFNSLGMRDEERQLVTDRPTVVVVGDSIEAWREFPVQNLYPRQLESLLDARYGSDALQVVNLGVTGYSLHQKVLMLQYRGLPLHPRVAVVGYCLNDPLPAQELINYFTGKAAVRPWRIVDLVNTRVRNLLHQYGIDFYSEIHQEGSDSWRRVVEDMQLLGTVSRDAGVKVVMVIFPLMVDTTVDYPWRDIHRRVAAEAERNGIETIDLLDQYQDAGFANVRTDTVHPNARGHRLAAEQLDRVLVADNVLALAPARAN